MTARLVVNDVALRKGLRDFWDAGLRQVSPQALGMHLWGRIYEQEDGKEIAAAVGARWDGTWIVMEKRP